MGPIDRAPTLNNKIVPEAEVVKNPLVFEVDESSMKIDPKELYYCQICEYNGGNRWKFDKHLLAETHRSNVLCRKESLESDTLKMPLDRNDQKDTNDDSQLVEDLVTDNVVIKQCYYGVMLTML